MAFCANCGSQVEGRFCAKCGASVPAGAAAPQPSYQQPQYQQPQASYPPPGGAPYAPPGPPPAVAAGMTDNAASALCYVVGLITGVIFLLLAPYNRNPVVRFHAFQSIFLNVAVILILIVFGFVDAILFGMAGFWLAYMIHVCLNLACIALWLYMVITTYQGKTTVLPVIGQIAQQQARQG